MEAREILEGGRDLVCVVRYRGPHAGDWYNGSVAPANPAVLHQVTLRPGKVSGDLIRLGETRWDEISGWQWVDALEVVAVLGEWSDGGVVTPVDWDG